MRDNQETTFPKLTTKDFTDPTMHKMNSLVHDIYEKLTGIDGKADEAIDQARRVSEAIAGDQRNFAPPPLPPGLPVLGNE